MVVALALLAAVLAAAVIRPRGWNEASFAFPAAAALIVSGLEPAHEAWLRVGGLAPTVTFLVLILAFGQLCADAGVFDYLGAVAAQRSAGDAGRLLLVVVGLAATVTAVLTLDATVVLLTPVVLRTAHRLGVPGRPHLYACTELANAGSLLLPVSNLTNLLAFTTAGLSFGRFTTLMALPWLAASILEWAALRLFFRVDLAAPGRRVEPPPAPPRYALGVLGLTVAGFVGASAVGLAPAWAAAGGLVLLAVPALRRHRTTPRRLLTSANLGFAAFVLSLGVIVDTVTRRGLSDALSHLVPAGASLPALLGVAFLAAVLANLVNNLPATLALLPLVSASPVAVLAVLIGVNVGPNATYAGSLATLLWRRLLPADDRPQALQFHAFGLLSVPIIIAASTVALWAIA